MRRFWASLLALTVALAAGLAFTFATPLGGSLWHYNASFVAALALAGVSWRWLRRRRVATLAMAFSGAVATVSGFVMLYTRDFPAKDWITWWHSFTSFALLLAFLVHWLNNHPRLVGFTARLLRRDVVPGAIAALVWVGVLAAAAWTWFFPEARALFTRESYLGIASWTVLLGVGATYGTWLAYRAPALRARLRVVDHRNGLRALVDTSLYLSHWGALITGLALVWWSAPLRAGDLKYVSKWWHTVTSVAFVALVALHVGFNARLLAAHARRVDRELAGEAPPPDGAS